MFVEIGAYDGESVSNTSGLADTGWKGVYVEPVHEFYLKCLERHKNNDVIVSNISIGLDEGVQQIYSNGILSSLDQDYAEIGTTKFNYPDYKEELCFQLRMDTFLKKYNVPYDFDLLVVDVEGKEHEVFYSFDLNKWKPKMLIIELVDDHEYFQDKLNVINETKKLRNYIELHQYIQIYRDDINTIFIKNDII
jgi:FkbM family methyltransferase